VVPEVLSLMPRHLQIAPSLDMPLDAVTETLGIFGQKGSGKSSTSAVFVEQGVSAGGRFVIADPTGVWWGLMHDGPHGPGLPGIVFGGEHADVPLEPTAGHIVAEFVVGQDEYPVVVLDMKLMRKADRTRFMLSFLETLYHDNREALHVVLDESHQFAPTQAREGGDQIKLLGAVEDVVALGRARGLGITMISQRFATLNANVREQIGTLVAHRLVGSLDRKALKGWIEAQADPAREKEVMDVMAKLRTAQALVWSPAFLDFFGVVDVNAPVTFDSRATPKVGQRVKKPGRRAPVDLGVLRERMAATIEEAERNDPKKLREQQRRLVTRVEELGLEVARLERELAERPPVTVEVPVIDEATLSTLRDRVLDVERAQAGIEDAYGKLRGVLHPLATNVRDALDRQQFGKVPPRSADPPRLNATTRRSAPEAASETGASGGAQPPSNGTVNGPAQRVLDALAWYGALGIQSPDRIQVGFIAGYKVGKKGGGYFANLLSSMRTSGWIDYPATGAVTLTAEGAALARDPGLPRENGALQEAVLSRLTGPEARVIRVLLDVYPDAIGRVELGARAGYTVTEKGGGYFANMLGRLRTLGLLDYPRQGEVVATDVLFPVGARR
jgi:hypothetical protein